MGVVLVKLEKPVNAGNGFQQKTKTSTYFAHNSNALGVHARPLNLADVCILRSSTYLLNKDLIYLNMFRSYSLIPSLIHECDSTRSVVKATTFQLVISNPAYLSFSSLQQFPLVEKYARCYLSKTASRCLHLPTIRF